MPTSINVIRRPLITEKALTIREDRRLAGV